MNTTVNIILFTLCNLFFIYIFLLTSPSSNNKLFHFLTIFSIILYSILIYYILQNSFSTNEPFFFEVSPKRKQCLIEQVSPEYNTRTCGCCAKGTVGGYPAKYLDNDFISENPEDMWNWQRVDAFGDQKSKTPPTDSCESCGGGEAP